MLELGIGQSKVKYIDTASLFFFFPLSLPNICDYYIHILLKEIAIN